MKIYLAGPMRGIPNLNREAFVPWARRLREAGFTVFSPAEREEDEPQTVDFLAEARVKGSPSRLAMSEELAWICMEADAVALMPGWEKSKGSIAEKAVAEALGLEVIYLA